MASSFSSSSHHDVFPSFHSLDIRRGFLSHLHICFASKGIRTFKDQEIESGHTIGPKHVQAIRESRVSIVVLSKNYTSSSWCLDELVEIFKCQEEFGQIVMTIFYDVDPSDVKKQKGDFGKAFEKTCKGKADETKQRWSKALAALANIADEYSISRNNEVEMIQKIAIDVSNKLNVTPSRLKYDVFLSFRGEATRHSIVSHLYEALASRGLVTFKDDKRLETGDHISDELYRAIEGSDFVVVLLSENNATSKWCLMELQLIMELQMKGRLDVFPVFYGVQRSSVRHQLGSFDLRRYQRPEDADKVPKWREALNV